MFWSDFSHKILANRLGANIRLDPLQKGFAPLDGMMENTAVLDCVLSKFYTERKEIHSASIDLQKGFDSIAHDALPRVFTFLQFLFPTLTLSIHIAGRLLSWMTDGRH
ncbi:hypothetical protein AVEN_106357-1 [Araneus ventricosus]|uniref:Reverse transcriptase domain-containing protein n=1 Tax=Araneus ventricosus TaxID=182803 RepID=A0A4Y2AS80_ARAVE|nr:hypothetical protein AVEN_106357-1 [Araneus ventricosus]